MPANTTGFDARSFERELGRVFGEYRLYNQRALPLLLDQLSTKLSIDAYLEAAALRPQQIAKIEALKSRGWAIRRRKASDVVNAGTDYFRKYARGKNAGQFKNQSVTANVVRGSLARGINQSVTPEQEIALRERYAAIYQASGWISQGMKTLRHVFTMRQGAIVVKQVDANQLRIVVTNPRTNSAEYAEATGYLARAFQRRIADMRVYLARKMGGDAAEFSRPRPNFNKDARAEVERAMAGG